MDWRGSQPTLTSKKLAQPTKAWDARARAPLLGSELGRRGLTLSDLRRNGHPNYQGWDQAGRIMLCHHNVDAMCNAIILANQMEDAEDGGGTIDITSLQAGLISTPVKQARCVLRNVFRFSDPDKEIAFWSKPLGMFVRPHVRLRRGAELLGRGGAARYARSPGQEDGNEEARGSVHRD